MGGLKFRTMTFSRQADRSEGPFVFPDKYLFYLETEED